MTDPEQAGGGDNSTLGGGAGGRGKSGAGSGGVGRGAVGSGSQASRDDARADDARADGPALDEPGRDESRLDQAAGDGSIRDQTSRDQIGRDQTGPGIASLDQTGLDQTGPGFAGPGVASLNIANLDIASLDIASLDAALALARGQSGREGDGASPALLARVMADALDVQDARIAAVGAAAFPHPSADLAPSGLPVRGAPALSAWRAALAGLGGWAGLGGLTTAALAGVWVGVVQPAALTSLAAELLGQTASLDSVDLVPDFDDLLAEGS